MAKKNRGSEVVFKALIHCEGCAAQVNKCLTGFGGVEDVSMEREKDIVVAKGNELDPLKLLGRLQRKYSRNVELISPPIPKPQTQDQKKKDPPPKRLEEVKIKSLLLQVLMHCQGCADHIEKTVGKMQGVVSVEAEMKSSTVVVTGFFEDPHRLVEEVRKQLGKHVEVLKVEEKGKHPPPPPNKERKIIVMEEGGGDEYVCFCTPPHYTCQPRALHPNLIFSDDNVFACSIM